MQVARGLLEDYLTRLTLDRAVQKHFFGEQYVTLLNYAVCVGLQYENFAILGRAFRNRLPLLDRLLGGGGFEGTEVFPRKTLDEFKDYAKKREKTGAYFLKHITKTQPDKVKYWQNVGEDLARFEYIDMKPASFFSLARYEMNERECRELPLLPDEEDMQELNEEITLREAKTYLTVYGVFGISFGIFYPDLTEKMYHNPGIPQWNEIRKNHCPIILEELLNMSYKEREALILERVNLVAREHCPELLGELEFE